MQILLFLVFLTMSTVLGNVVPSEKLSNETENGNDYIYVDYGYGTTESTFDTTESVAFLVDDYIDIPENDPSLVLTSYTPEAAALGSGDPMKITIWVAVNSKVMSPTEREELISKGVIRPPLAMQKMVVVAHVDPSKTSPKTLKLYEVNAQVDPDFSKGKEETDPNT